MPLVLLSSVLLGSIGEEMPWALRSIYRQTRPGHRQGRSWEASIAFQGHFLPLIGKELYYCWVAFHRVGQRCFLPLILQSAVLLCWAFGGLDVAFAGR